MSFSLARALGPEVRVNVVAPGYVRTPWQVAAHGADGAADLERRFAERAPLKAAAEAAGRRRGDRLADRRRAPRHRRDRLRRRRHAHRFAALSLRLHHRRRGIGGLRARQSPYRRSAHEGPAARSRAARHRLLDPRAARLRQAVRAHRRQLGLRVGARAGAERPAHLHAARQGARRLLVDQRPGLHPRPARGLRRLGHPGLGLRRAAAVLREEPSAQLKVVGPRAPDRALRRVHRLGGARSASRATTTSTARRRKAPATTGHRTAGRRRSTAVGAICGPRRSGRTCGSRPTRLPPRILFEGKQGDRESSIADGKTVTAPEAAKSFSRGGAFNSPQLLQLSGVGPRALLEQHGIPVVHDAPQVGERPAGPFLRAHVLALQQADHAERRHDEPLAQGRHRAATTCCSRSAGRSPSARAMPPRSCAPGPS